MLNFDRNATLPITPFTFLTPRPLSPFLARNTAAPFAQLRGNGNGCKCSGMGDYETSSGYNAAGLGDYDAPSGYSPAGLAGLGDITDTMSTIASFDPEPISSSALQVAATATRVINQIESFFGIGAGRREADQIVPIQNDMHYNIIKPVYDVLELPDKSAVSCQTLATLYQSAYAAWQKWIDFLHNTNWSDGRAAVQAEATLAPYWSTILGAPGAPGGLEQIFNSKQCGVWKPPVVPGAQATITVQPGATTYGYPGFNLGGDFGAMLQQYAPYLLAGLGFLLLTRSSKRW